MYRYVCAAVFGAILICGACTPAEESRAKQKTNEAGQKLEKDMKEAGQEIKEGLKKAKREIHEATADDADRKR